MSAHNLILNTDSYKFSHYLQYPPGTTRVSSYIESRGGAYENVVFFGLQAYLKAYLQTPITAADVDEAEALALAHVGAFNREGWMQIVERHGGKLPIEITALPEGSVVPSHIPVLQIINTDPAFPWLPSYLETSLLRAVWYPSTVASLSYACRGILRRYLLETADSLDGLPFQLHDFGARGATTDEAAGIGGAAHLLNFSGTDTVPALLVARRYYHEPLAGYSIPAAEHSTITSWGRDGEAAAYRNLVQRFDAPGKLVAMVVDSYDIWNALDTLIGGELHDEILNRGGRVVVRPDSGDPIAVVPRVVEHLMRSFGYTQNSKGYRVLPPQIRVIQGDGITVESLPRILEALKMRAISTENLAFGMGAGLLQKLDRDTLRWAMKASWIEVNGQPRDVYKDPITDPGKRSKAGRLAVTRDDSGYHCVREEQLGTSANLLRPVFRDGALLIDDTFADIRRRVASAMP